MSAFVCLFVLFVCLFALFASRPPCGLRHADAGHAEEELFVRICLFDLFVFVLFCVGWPTGRSIATTAWPISCRCLAMLRRGEGEELLVRFYLFVFVLFCVAGLNVDRDHRVAYVTQMLAMLRRGEGEELSVRFCLLCAFCFSVCLFVCLFVCLHRHLRVWPTLLRC